MMIIVSRERAMTSKERCRAVNKEIDKEESNDGQEERQIEMKQAE